tara:strand:- start:113 stop:787 length:675 start_codon:yes stop_codon:yes gene_type:complete
MAIITTGQAFTATEQVTNTKLQDIASKATFNDPVDGTSLELIPLGTNAGKLGILDAGVTKAKIENLTDYTVLGNVSGGASAPAEVTILDEDTLVTDSATALATQQSIKAYVDSNGITQTTGTAPYYGCRAWAYYNQVTDTVEASGNIASIVRTATGYSTVTFTEPMPSAFYSIQITGSGNVNVQHTIGFISGAPTASSFGMAFFNTANSGNVANNDKVCITVFA